MTDDYGSTSGACPPDETKDPDEIIDFGFNWAPKLDGDVIISSIFVLPDGLTQVSTSNDATSTAIFVSGGTSGTTYRITNRVTTSGGRTYDRTINVVVQDA